MNQSFFITGTDTGVGKTIATFVLGTLLQKQGLDVGIMKPIQCAGDDAAFLKRKLNIKDPLNEINPFLAKEPLSPHLAFQRQGTPIHINQVIQIHKNLQEKHDVLLIEGAGGLLVPLKNKYLVADLVRDLDLELMIVSRLGLGTINHTLLTIQQAREKGIRIKGIVFVEASQTKKGVPEQTNPKVIEKIGNVKVLGTIPYLKKMDRATVLRQCSKQINTKVFLTASKNQKARRLNDWDREYVWHPFTQMQDWLREEPLVIDEAKDCYLKDTQGRRYLDGVSSLWVNVHGHRNQRIDQAIKSQVNQLSHSTLLGLSNTPAIELAKKLVEITPKGLQKVFYSDNGSTAVEVAIKMAYQYWQNIGQTKKINIIHLSNSYHGDTLGSVSVGGIDLFHKVYKNLIFKTIQFPLPDFYRNPPGQTPKQYALRHLKKLKQLFKTKHRSTAALVVEPLVQGAAGMLVWPKGVLKEMERLCREYDILLIADEVATGFGRTGKMFACEHEHVRPDLFCLAKGLTGGYLPLAATLTTQRIYDGFLFAYKAQKTFFHGHTYTGNPLCCAAALANLQVFEKERVLKKLQPKIKFLSEQLKMFYNLRNVGDVRQKGFMVGIELVKDKRSKTPFAWEEQIGVRVCEKIREYGVILRPLGNVVVIMPPLSITKNELGYLLKVTYKAIETVTKC